MSEPGKRIWKTYENGIELDGIFFPTSVAASLKADDKLQVVEIDGQRYFVKAETERPR